MLEGDRYWNSYSTFERYWMLFPDKKLKVSTAHILQYRRENIRQKWLVHANRSKLHRTQKSRSGASSWSIASDDIFGTLYTNILYFFLFRTQNRHSTLYSTFKLYVYGGSRKIYFGGTLHRIPVRDSHAGERWEFTPHHTTPRHVRTCHAPTYHTLPHPITPHHVKSYHVIPYPSARTRARTCITIDFWKISDSKLTLLET